MIRACKYRVFHNKYAKICQVSLRMKKKTFSACLFVFVEKQTITPDLVSSEEIDTKVYKNVLYCIMVYTAY